MPGIIAYRQIRFEHLGFFETALEESKCTLHLNLIDSESPRPSEQSILQSSGLILLGGPMSANDPLPFLHHQLQVLEIALARQIPILGICLGAQLLARAAGGNIYRNHEKEIGFYNVHLTSEGRADPVMGKLNAAECVFHWHSDSFDLPAGAELLATSSLTRNQAFRIGESAYGLQFHPEVTPAMITQWCAEDVNCGDMAEIEKPFDPNHNAARLAEVARIIFRPWIQLVLKRAL